MVASAAPTRLCAAAVVDSAPVAPALRTSGLSNLGSAQSYGVTLGTILPGDFVILAFTVASSSSIPGATQDDSALASYTRIGPLYPGGQSAAVGSVWIYYKVADGNEATMFVWTPGFANTNSAQLVYAVYSGGDPVLGWYALSRVTVTGGTSVASSPNLFAKSFGTAVQVHVSNSATVTTPTGWTLVGGGPAAAGAYLYLFYRSMVTAGTQSLASQVYNNVGTGYVYANFLVPAAPQAAPPTALYTSGGAGVSTTITEIEMVNDDLYEHTFRVKDGGSILVPGLVVPAKSTSQYQLRQPMAANEVLAASANGPGCTLNASGVVTT
jgi:hypothetical protein